MKRVTISDWSLAAPGRDGLRIAVDGVLLLLALWGTVFTTVSAYGIETDVLWLGGVCLLLGALYLILFSWTRIMLPGTFFIMVLWGTLVWLDRETLRGGVLQISGYVLDTLSGVFDVGWIELPELSAPARRELVTRALSMAVVPVGGLLGWSVIRARSPALTLLMSLLFFLPALLSDALPAWLPLMALVFCYCLLLLASVSARHDPRGSARFTLLCMPFTALLLAALTLLLPEEYTAPRWAGLLWTGTEDAAAAMMDSGRLDSLFSGGGVETTARLDRAGPRRFTGNTVFTVSGDTPGRVYLRGISMANYTGSAWEPLDGDAYAEIGLDGDNNLIDGISPLNLPSLTAQEQDYSELRIHYGNSLSGCMYAPYQLTTAPSEVDGVTFQNDAWLSRRFGIQEKNLFYRPNAAPVAARSLTGAAASAEKAYRQFVYDNYLSLPPGFQQTIDRWAHHLEEIFAENPDAEVKAIHARQGTYSEFGTRFAKKLTRADWYALLLELSADYDLDTPYTPDGADFVDYFLNESRRGYCVHFASAGVLLMRASGIPARYVEGYTTVIPASGEAEVLDSDAHAWVEIYLDGYGWYPVDMTPPDSTGIAPHSILGENTPDTPDTPEEKPEQDAEKEEKPDTPEPETKKPSPSGPEPEETAPAEPEPRSVLWLWVLPLLLVLAVLPAQSALRRELLDRRLNAPDRNKAVIAAYAYLERLARWGGEIPPEAVSLAQKARFSQHVLTEEERARMLALAEDERERLWAEVPRWKRPLFWLSGL